jgi:transcriptional regulator with XRE-family HTH domain
MTQQELASFLGYSQSYISKYEQGQKRLDIIEIREICEFLGSSLLEVITLFEERLKKEGLV